MTGIRQLVPAVATMEGAGVTVHRSLGTPALKNLDPFLLLDHFSSDNPDDYIAGFPDHPHRGFNTFTYMLDGNMQHRDSMGNEGHLQAGGAQWMKAASGVIHSEMPKQVAGLMRGFQLWVNLPAAEKMSAPAYQEYPHTAFPHVALQGASIKVVVGEYQGSRSPVTDVYTEVQYLDIRLQAGVSLAHEIPAMRNAFVYVFEGDAVIEETQLAPHYLAVLSAGETTVTAAAAGARYIFVCGRPLREPIVQHGPFVMNTREEIEQAFADYRDGNLVRDKAKLVSKTP